MFAGGPTPDEAVGLGGGHIEPEALLSALESSPRRDLPRADLVKLQDRIGRVLCAALAGSRSEQRAALGALVERTTELAMGAVTAKGSPPGSAAKGNTLGSIGATIRPCVAGLAQLKSAEGVAPPQGADGDEGVDGTAAAAASVLKGIDTTPESPTDVATAAAGFVRLLGSSGGEKGWENRLAAARGLAKLVPDAGAPARPVEDALLMAALDSTAIVRAEAARALCRSSSPRVRRRLEELGRDRSPAVRDACRLDLPR